MKKNDNDNNDRILDLFIYLINKEICFVFELFILADLGDNVMIMMMMMKMMMMMMMIMMMIPSP
jgi:hypothetical protein